MRFLVTGGAGFIGSHFVRRHLDSTSPSNSIIVLDALTYAGNVENLAPVMNSENLTFVHGDILDRRIVDSLMENVDVVVNFAAESHVDRSINDPGIFARTNIIGTQTLLDSALKFKITKFIQISTDEVYGSIENGSWDENFPISPNSPYAASKASGDLLALSYFKTYGLNVCVTRCSNNYGPYQYPEKIIPLFVTNILQGLKLPLYGTGLNSRDWLHVDDHCRAIELVIQGGIPGEIYNIGGGKELTNLELTHFILKQMSLNQDSIRFVDDRLGHDIRYSVNYEKIAKQLGYTPRMDFKTGILNTIDWYKSNRLWWEPLKKSTI